MGGYGVEGQVLAIALSMLAIEGEKEVGEDEVERGGYDSRDEEALVMLALRWFVVDCSTASYLDNIDESRHGCLWRPR